MTNLLRLLLWLPLLVVRGVRRLTYLVIHAIGSLWSNVLRGVRALKSLAIAAAKRVRTEVLARFPTTVTISIEDDTAHVGVHRLKKLVGWREVSLGEHVGAPESARALLTAIRAMGARGGKIVTDVPAYAALLRHVPLTRIAKGLRQEVVTNQVNDTILLAPQDVDIKWQVEKRRDGDHALVTVVPKEHVDRLVSWLRSGRLRPAAAYSKAHALALGVDARDAIVIRVGKKNALLVLVQDAQPLVTYSIPVHNLEGDTSGVVATLAQAIEEIAFYQTAGQPNAAPKPDEASSRLPVLLVCSQRTYVALAHSLHEAVDRTITWSRSAGDGGSTSPEDDDYTVNLGLWRASKGRPTAKTAVPKTLAVNLLSERHLPRPFPAFQAFVFLSLTGLAWASPSLMDAGSEMQTRGEILADRVDALKASDREKRLASLRAKSAAAKDAVAREEADRIAAYVSGLAEANGDLVGSLRSVTGKEKELGIQLSAVIVQAGDVNLDGSAPSFEALLSYADALRNDPLFREVKVLRTESGAATESGEGGLSFQMRVKAARQPITVAASVGSGASATPTPAVPGIPPGLLPPGVSLPK